MLRRLASRRESGRLPAEPLAAAVDLEAPSSTARVAGPTQRPLVRAAALAGPAPVSGTGWKPARFFREGRCSAHIGASMRTCPGEGLKRALAPLSTLLRPPVVPTMNARSIASLPCWTTCRAIDGRHWSAQLSAPQAPWLRVPYCRSCACRYAVGIIEEVIRTRIPPGAPLLRDCREPVRSRSTDSRFLLSSTPAP